MRSRGGGRPSCRSTEASAGPAATARRSGIPRER
jgi:hypothetical protein